MNAPTAPTMRGTTGTEYTVVAGSPMGMLGFRELGDAEIRIRVVPSGPEHVQNMAEVLKEGRWKQPGEYGYEELFRFSMVTWGLAEALNAADLACSALGITDLQSLDDVHVQLEACFQVVRHRSDDESFKMPELGSFAKFCEGLAAFVRRLMPG